MQRRRWIGVVEVCGVAGWLGVVPDPEVNAELLAGAMRHRGPDSHGYRCWSDAALVSTRLKIIDLSPSGDQPLANETAAVWAVLNGEIYNYHELRRSLETRGHKLRGRSDTGVLPHLYEEYGEGLVDHIRGMFGLAIYDMQKRHLVLARDRLGIKPLFYGTIRSEHGSALAFASELNALLHLPGVDDTPDRQALFDYMGLSYIPAPQTFYRGIRSLEPGEVLKASFEQASLSFGSRLYHRWHLAPDPSLALGQAVNRADELIETAVRRQIESDVPLGSMLSGGIDSSLVSAAARRHVGQGFQTFNVKVWEESYDETWAAKAVANHIGSTHQTLVMEAGAGGWDEVTALLAHAGQPFADTSLFATDAVCRLMREHVTVALSGDGGDEVFGGYNSFWRVAEVARLQRLPVPLWIAGAAGLGLASSVLPRAGMLARRARGLADADDTGVIQQCLTGALPEEHRKLMPGDELLPTRRWFEQQWRIDLPPGSSRIERLSAKASEVHLRLVLPNAFLFKVDTASMRHSIEIRVPLLDEDLLAFSMTLPQSLKVHRRTAKVIPRQLARMKLPLAVATRPKQGWGIPVDTWVDEDFKRRLPDYLLNPGSDLDGFFERRSYAPLIMAFARGEAGPKASRVDTYQQVIRLLSVQVVLDAAKRLRGLRLSR